jgi:hypothetical protein
MMKRMDLVFAFPILRYDCLSIVDMMCFSIRDPENGSTATDIRPHHHAE